MLSCHLYSYIRMHYTECLGTLLFAVEYYNPLRPIIWEEVNDSNTLPHYNGTLLAQTKFSEKHIN